jgi:hypothetical protein
MNLKALYLPQAMQPTTAISLEKLSQVDRQSALKKTTMATPQITTMTLLGTSATVVTTAKMNPKEEINGAS